MAPHSASGVTSSRWRRYQPCTAADRKSTRLNSSHSQISYAVFCFKKKKFRSDRKSTRLNSNHSQIAYAVFCLSTDKRFTTYRSVIDIEMYVSVVDVTVQTSSLPAA